jgi:hypothetical protein
LLLTSLKDIVDRLLHHSILKGIEERSCHSGIEAACGLTQSRL